MRYLNKSFSVPGLAPQDWERIFGAGRGQCEDGKHSGQGHTYPPGPSIIDINPLAKMTHIFQKGQSGAAIPPCDAPGTLQDASEGANARKTTPYA